MKPDHSPRAAHPWVTPAWPACLACSTAALWLAPEDLRGSPWLWAGGALGCALLALTAWTAGAWRHQRATVAVVLLASASLCLRPPSLSDDVHRYAWEGRAQRVRLDAPYVHPPSSLVLPDLPRGSRARVAHPDISAAYPPTAQLLLNGLARVEDAVGGAGAFQWAAWAVAAALVAWLRRRGVEAWPLLAVHPLWWLESAQGAHLDAFAGAALAAAVVWVPSRPWMAGALLGVSVGIKPWGILLFPWLLACQPRALLAAVATVAAFTVPYASAGGALLRGLGAYAQHWEFNGAAWRGFRLLLDAVLPDPERVGFTHVWLGSGGAGLARGARWVWQLGAPAADGAVLVDARMLARGLSVVAVLATAAWALRRFHHHPARHATLVLCAALLCAPTVHPWYALMVLPVATVAGARGVLLGASTLLLSYAVWRTGSDVPTWSEPAWPAPVWTLCVALGTAWDVRAWSQDAPATHTNPATNNPHVAPAQP